MKIALAQVNPTTGDLQGNVEKVIEYLEDAKRKNAGLVVFPEMVVTGYCISDLIEDEDFVKENKKALDEIAKHTQGVVAVVGFIDYDTHERNEDGRLRKYNAAAVFQDGKIVGIAHKTLLPNYGIFDDKRYFTPANRREPIPVKLEDKVVKLGVSICEDMWDENYQEKPISELAIKKADLIININASPFVAGKHLRREEIARGHVQNTDLPFIYVNTVGAADNGKNIIPFDGESFVYDRSGMLIARGKQFGEELLLVDLDTGKKAPERVFEKEKEIYNALVMSLKDYARKTGFEKAVISISGGIDSALGLAITVDAFGKDNVVTYNLPSQYNSETTRNIAKELARNFGVEYRISPIYSIDLEILKTFDLSAHTVRSKVAKENLHARIRGILMMLHSNDTNSLLISNGNETEIALGYSTLYGDMCGGISVIGDLSKVDVYAVSRYVNEKYGKEMIPEGTFTIKPSAELSEGQYDPFDYSVVAPLVGEFAERRISPRALVDLFNQRKLDEKRFLLDKDGKSVYDKHSAETFEKLSYEMYRLFQRSVYKRLQGPPIIIVSERSFGFDFRETIINKWLGKRT